MATTNNPEIASFPLARSYSADARARRVNELREQVRAGTYRLDAESVALAILESGALESPPLPALIDTRPEALRCARARFVVVPSDLEDDARRSAAV